MDGSVWADVDDPGRWCPVPAAVPMPGSIKEAVLARLSVWLSAALRPKQPDQQPPLPPFAARLCQGKPATDLRTPSAPLAPAQRDCSRRLAPTALIRKSGHGQQSVVPLVSLAPQLPAHRAGPSPPGPPRGRQSPGRRGASATVSALNPQS